MTISEYLGNLNQRYKTGISREHSYRGGLQTLLESMLDNVLVTNEPARIECGAPDYILTNKSIPVGYIEAKDIGEPLKGKKHKEQFERYKASLPNLIITDYLDFYLYREGDFVTSIRIADTEDGSIQPRPHKFAQFKNLINDFATHTAQTITSSSKLSKMMAGKARLLSTIIENALNSDAVDNQVNEAANNTLREQLEAFQNVLIHDIDAKEFADIYAQTIAYGMFAARLHDPTLDSFSRFEAAQLIPKTNPFLRKLFQYIAGYDLDERVDWVVDALADIFRATDVATLLKDFGKATQQNDPIIHFYENFLAEFDPALRKSRGVWYTPEPVVNFIVRAVDDILKDEFDLTDGLADTTKTTVTVKTDVPDKRTASGYKHEEQEVHKVQILDPAAGTGTFLAEVINQIHSKFEGQKGIWPSYVENHLIPRLNGFELLMASYAMAHLKLDLLLRETGYNREANQRFRVYLTNSLEEHHPDTGTLFASWLSEEANQANHVKRDTPVMVVMGNPPYSGISSNMGEWISNLIEDYKYVDGEHFGERKHWLHDDYVKFIRYGQHFVEKNGEGVLAYINNHGFLDNPTFRGMRWNLLKTFNKIFIVDLHGNSLKKEKTPEDNKDENVFDIQTGVSINIFVKSDEKNSKDLGKIYHTDFWGRRGEKYSKLWDNGLKEIDFQEVNYKDPSYYFIPKEEEGKKEYKKGFNLDEVFPNSKTGIVTMGDTFIISQKKERLKNRINDFLRSEYTEEELRDKYGLGKNYPGWILENKIEIKVSESDFVKIAYRPFDTQWTIFDNQLLWRWRYDTMQHFINSENVGLVFARQSTDKYWTGIQIVDTIVDNRFHFSQKGIPQEAPLYLYPNDDQQTLGDKPERKPNLDPKIIHQIANGIDLTFTPEKEDTKGTFAPIDLLDYIYTVLHSPTYREKYKEFLKIDFPRVPYPTDAETFWQLVELGSELREIHLLEHPIINNFITTYPVEGSNEITKRLTKTKPGFILYDEEKEDEDEAPTHTPDYHRYPGERLGKIQINDEQYFGMVPEKAWNFYIGGYQPAEKWLKDRRDRELSFEEIQHYQRIIVALMETDQIMGEIDTFDFEK